MADAVSGIAVESRQGRFDTEYMLSPVVSLGLSNKGTVEKTVTFALLRGDTVETDIAADKSIRRVSRSAVRQFRHEIGAEDGTRIFIEKTGARAFRISPIL